MHDLLKYIKTVLISVCSHARIVISDALRVDYPLISREFYKILSNKSDLDRFKQASDKMYQDNLSKIEFTLSDGTPYTLLRNR